MCDYRGHWKSFHPIIAPYFCLLTVFIELLKIGMLCNPIHYHWAWHGQRHNLTHFICKRALFLFTICIIRASFSIDRSFHFIRQHSHEICNRNHSAFSLTQQCEEKEFSAQLRIEHLLFLSLTEQFWFDNYRCTCTLGLIEINISAIFDTHFLPVFKLITSCHQSK